MSNILIIKHGSLGDLIQANGAIKDIKEFYSNRKVFLLTSRPYSLFMSECPYIDGVIIDKKLPRWNLFYLYNLKKLLSKYQFAKVFDLQNSRRTRFYKNFILKNLEWSSSLNLSIFDKSGILFFKVLFNEDSSFSIDLSLSVSVIFVFFISKIVILSINSPADISANILSNFVFILLFLTILE